MFLGDGEPDLEALATTLQAISSRPQDFSLAEISNAATIALEIISSCGLPTAQCLPIEVYYRTPSHHCPGQTTIHDFLSD